MSLLSDVTKYWMEGTVRSLEGWRRGLMDTYPVEEDPTPTTPYNVVYEGGMIRLRHYPTQGQRLHTPLLLTYSLIKRPFIWICCLAEASWKLSPSKGSKSISLTGFRLHAAIAGGALTRM